MKKWFVWLGLMLITALQIYGQAPKDAQFTEKVFFAGFDEEDKPLWPAQNSQYYFLLVQNSRYQMECKSPEKRAYLLPKGAPQHQVFKAETNIIIDKKAAKDLSGSIGMAISVQNKLASGYLFEINSDRQYRVTQILGSGNYKFLTGSEKKEGWLYSKEINNAGKNNKLTVLQNGGRIKFLINNEQLFQLTVETLPAGQNGLFIYGIMKATASDFSIYTPVQKSFDSAGNEVSVDNSKSIDKSSAENKIAEDKKEKPEEKVNTNNANDANGDMNTLNEALLKCRVESKNLNQKNENLQLQLDQAKKKQEELQKFISENLDVKLQAELEQQKKKNEELSKKVETLSAENKDLKTFKKDIEKNKDGDLVIILSEQLKKEREKTTSLEEKVKKLEQELAKTKKTGK